MPRPPETTTFASPRSGRSLFCVACSATSSAPSASTAPTGDGLDGAGARRPAAGGGNAVWRTLATTTGAADLDLLDRVAGVRRAA